MKKRESVTGNRESPRGHQRTVKKEGPEMEETNARLETQGVSWAVRERVAEEAERRQTKDEASRETVAGSTTKKWLSQWLSLAACNACSLDLSQLISFLLYLSLFGGSLKV